MLSHLKWTSNPHQRKILEDIRSNGKCKEHAHHLFNLLGMAKDLGSSFLNFYSFRWSTNLAFQISKFMEIRWKSLWASVGALQGSFEAWSHMPYCESEAWSQPLTPNQRLCRRSHRETCRLRAGLADGWAHLPFTQWVSWPPTEAISRSLFLIKMPSCTEGGFGKSCLLNKQWVNISSERAGYSPSLVLFLWVWRKVSV